MAKKAKKEKATGAVRTDKRESVFGNPIRNLIITALVSILLGVAFLVEAGLVYTYCGYALGGVIGLAGLAYIIIYFCKKPVSGVYRYEFAFGLVALLAGAYVALGGYLGGSTSSAGLGFNIILKIIGVLIVADGVLKLQYSIDLARMRYPRWWLVLILSVVGIALGVAVVMGYAYDIGGNMALGGSAFSGGMIALGAAFCLNGLLDLLSMMMIAIRNHKARREEAIAEGSAMVAAAKQEEIPTFVPEEPKPPVTEVPEAPAPAAPEPPVVEAPAQAIPADSGE